MRYIATIMAATMLMVATPSSASADESGQVAQDIASSLRTSGKLSGYSIGVKYKDGTAWLRGHVSSEKQRQAALAVVRKHDRVSNVVENLSVNNSAVRSMPSGVLDKGALIPSSAVSRRGKLASSNEYDGPSTGDVRRAQAEARMARAAADNSAAPIPHDVEYRGQISGRPIPTHMTSMPGGVSAARYDHPHMPNHAWPSYAAYPNYAAVTYPSQYSATAWPFIGPFYPYPQVPLGWRKVTLEWDDGWWMLDFKHH
jgi:hypothetical protein